MAFLENLQLTVTYHQVEALEALEACPRSMALHQPMAEDSEVVGALELHLQRMELHSEAPEVDLEEDLHPPNMEHLDLEVDVAVAVVSQAVTEVVTVEGVD